MATFTQKELKQLVKAHVAIDATEDLRVVHEKYWWVIGTSRGKYGVNGCLIYGQSGKLYAVTERNSNLFFFY